MQFQCLHTIYIRSESNTHLSHAHLIIALLQLCNFLIALLQYVLDIIDTRTCRFKQITRKKLHKHICIAKSESRALEPVRLPEILIHPDFIKTLAYNLQKNDRIPTVTYKLGDTLRNNILNYKM